MLQKIRNLGIALRPWAIGLTAILFLYQGYNILLKKSTCKVDGYYTYCIEKVAEIYKNRGQPIRNIILESIKSDGYISEYEYMEIDKLALEEIEAIRVKQAIDEMIANK